MSSRPFAPSARQVNVLLVVGFMSVGYALYLRYLAIENTPVGLACQSGLQTWLCTTRQVATALFNHNAFGWVALIVASVNLLRPSIFLTAVALGAAGLGIVLYNVALSALAASLLILVLARPSPVEE